MKKICFLSDYRDVSAGARKILKIMKLTTFLIVLTCLQTFALTNYAQNKKIEIKVHNATLASVLNQIENESDYFFFYNNKVLDLDRVVSLDVVV